jgi:hypothetical protein
MLGPCWAWWTTSELAAMKYVPLQCLCVPLQRWSPRSSLCHTYIHIFIYMYRARRLIAVGLLRCLFCCRLNAFAMVCHVTFNTGICADVDPTCWPYFDCLMSCWFSCIYIIYLFLGREKGRTIGRGKGRAKGTIKGRVDWRAVIEGFIIVLHGCIQTPILLPPGRISVGSDFQKI